jgi:hypothetical protein
VSKVLVLHYRAEFVVEVEIPRGWSVLPHFNVVLAFE